MKFLSALNMSGGYGGADIIHDCDITVEKGEIAVVVGPNGAGKSTAMKAVFGMLDLHQGTVLSSTARILPDWRPSNGSQSVWDSYRKTTMYLFH